MSSKKKDEDKIDHSISETKNSNNIKAVEMFNSGIGPRTFPQSGGLDHTWPQPGCCPKGWKIRLKGF